jgi:hypothetical protein
MSTYHVNGCTITKLEPEEAADFYPPKNWHVRYPVGEVDWYNATTRYTRTLSEARECAREKRLSGDGSGRSNP